MSLIGTFRSFRRTSAVKGGSGSSEDIFKPPPVTDIRPLSGLQCAELGGCFCIADPFLGAAHGRNLTTQCTHRQGELKRGTVGYICRAPEAATMGLHDRTAD